VSEPTRATLWVPVVLYMIGIFGLSSLSVTPRLPTGADKGAHALLYLGLGLLLARALSRGHRRSVTLGTALLVTAIAALYGISDEFHQSFVPPRQVEGLDVVADTIGAAAAAFGRAAWDIIHSRHGV
jgi:VanZ family protein